MADKARFTMQFLQSVIGTQGPLQLNMNVYRHDLFTDHTPEECAEGDMVTVCPDGEEITLKILADILQEYNAREDVQTKIDSGRSYWFEGMVCQDDVWHMQWGS